jgi:thioredoxin-like negative regulator of GroEL
MPLTDAQSTQSLHNHAVSLAKQGGLEGAIPFFRQVLEADPNSTDCLGNLAFAYIQSGKPEEAVEPLGAIKGVRTLYC